MTNDFVLSGTYTLPSEGKVYSRDVNPVVTLRSMTTEEEMKRLSFSERPYKIMSGIIDDCLVDDIGIPVYDLCIGDYQFLLQKLRVVTYGPEYSMNITCPFCKSTVTETINLDEFKIKPYTSEVLNYMEFDLPISKKHIALRMQTPRLLDDVQVESIRFKKESPSFEGEPAFLFTLKALIKEIDGERPNPLTVNDMLKKLPMKDAAYIIQQGERLHDCVGVDTSIVATCPVCGAEYNAPFRQTKEFFGPTVHI